MIVIIKSILLCLKMKNKKLYEIIKKKIIVLYFYWDICINVDSIFNSMILFFFFREWGLIIYRI